MSNRLARETSPYLLQHADNPVDWYPWGEEALSRARAEDKPILLSIGYSACHWCHVMERESFEDEATASLMNQGFVNIKVDREERPDIDSIYMRAVQSSLGRGGWPLTAFLTPQGRFFYGGTYFPPQPRQGMPSFQQVLTAVLDAYQNRREEIEAGAHRLLSALRGRPGPEAGWRGGEGPEETGAEGGADSTEGPRGDDELEVRLSSRGPDALDRAAQALARDFDPRHGGFGPAPKFPQPVTLEFLLRHFHRAGSQESLDMVLTTLRAMANGGMRDHLGGGFHRYSVDQRWLVPHFEKMLYDNGLLARVYLHAYQITRDPELEDVVRSTLDYLMDDLRDPAGGFYAARDADSEGEEGLFYLWTPEEVEAVLGPEDSALFCRIYDVSATGNFEGQNILHLPHGLSAAANREGRSREDLAQSLDRARSALRKQRETREHPFRDEKVLVGWNSFVLRALAEAGAALGEARYIVAAAANADFLLEALRHDGRLRRSWKDGDSRVPAFLEDYAGLGNALLSLYEADLDDRWLTESKTLADQILDLFWDEEDGLFFDAARDGEELVVRPREAMDNATPSGNSLAIELLLRASVLFGIGRYREVAVRALLREMDVVVRFPSAFGRYLSSLALALSAPLEVTLLGDPDGPEMAAFRSTALRDFLPARFVVGGVPGRLPLLPALEGRDAPENGITAYVCRDFSCTPPLSDPEALELALKESVRRPTGAQGAKDGE